MQHITMEDWREFERLFPEARQWLLRASLRGELAQLRFENSGAFPTEWQKNRLAELERLERTTRKIKEGGL